MRLGGPCSLIQIQKEIMTNKQKKEARLAIVTDAYLQLKDSVVQKANGYVEPNSEGHQLLNHNYGKSLQPLVCNLRKECKICAKGALFLSAVGIYYKFKISST